MKPRVFSLLLEAGIQCNIVACLCNLKTVWNLMVSDCVYADGIGRGQSFMIKRTNK